MFETILLLSFLFIIFDFTILHGRILDMGLGTNDAGTLVCY